MARTIIRNQGNAVRTVAASTQSITFGNILLSHNVITAAVWLKLRAATSSNFDVAFGYGNTRWYFIFNSTTNRPGFNIKIGGVEKASGYITAPLKLNDMYLLVGTYDPNGGSNNLTIRVYNYVGQLVGTASSTQTGNPDTSAQNLTFGRDPSRAFNMSVDGDDLRVYSRLLSVAEQDALALGQEPDPTGLELLVRCNEASGNPQDSSGNGRHGTNNNGCTFVPSFMQARTQLS